MGILYAAIFSGVAVTAQQDFFETTGPSDGIIIIHSIELAQTTELGDAAEEQLSILLKRGATTSGTGGTQTISEAALETGSPVYGGVTDINNTTKASAGTIVTLGAYVWNVRSPFLWMPPPEHRFILAPSTRFTVELATTPVDSITMNGTMIIEAIGG